MTFEKLIDRVLNMVAYGLGVAEIHDQLLAEGVDEQIVFFAYVAAKTVAS